MNPYLIIGSICGMIACFVWGDWHGASKAELKCALAQTTKTIKAQDTTIAHADTAGKASVKLEVDNAKEKIVYRDITRFVDRIVDRPVYRSICLDDDGLRAAAAAIDGTAPDTPGRPDNPMPAALAPDGRDRQERPAMDRGYDANLPGMRAAPRPPD